MNKKNSTKSSTDINKKVTYRFQRIECVIDQTFHITINATKPCLGSIQSMTKSENCGKTYLLLVNFSTEKKMSKKYFSKTKVFCLLWGKVLDEPNRSKFDVLITSVLSRLLLCCFLLPWHSSINLFRGVYVLCQACK